MEYGLEIYGVFLLSKIYGMVVCSKIYRTVVCSKIYYRYFDLEIHDGVLRLENAGVAGTSPAGVAGFHITRAHPAL